MKTTTCGQLCDRADALFARAPWERMPETEIFALQAEADGEIYFVSVMGAAGDFHAVAFYPGRESFSKFCAAQSEDLHPRDALEVMLANEHWQVAFETRTGLQPAEKTALRHAGRRYRGPCPVFRRHRAARVPWPVDEAGAHVLLPLMAAAMEVLDRLAGGEKLTARFTAEEFFLRRADGTDGVCRPQDLLLPQHRLSAPLDPRALAGVERVTMNAEMELALMLSPVAEVPRGEPPYFPYLLILADSDTGTILGAEMISTREGVDTALTQLPQTIIGLLGQAGVVPSRLAVRHPILHSALAAYGRLLGFEVVPQPFLPAAELALAHLEEKLRL